MAIQEVINEVKDRLEPVVDQAQDVAQTSLDVLKQANTIVVKNAKTLAKTEAEAARDLYDAAVASVSKARDAGVKEVAADPVAYLPEGRERVVSAYNDTVDVLAKAGNDLGKVLKKGYNSIGVELGLIEKKAAPKKAAPRKAAPKKASGAKSTTRKTTTKKASA